MEIKLIYFRVLIVVLIVLDFSVANNEQKRRRPPIESQHDVYATHDSDGNYLDQIASDSFQYNSQNVIVPPPSSEDNYYAEPFRGEEPNYPKQKPIKKTMKPSMTTGKPAEVKVHYITPQPYSPEEYVQSAMDLGQQQFTYSREPVTTKENTPAHSFFEKTTTTIEKKPLKKPTKIKTYQQEPEDYNYYFPESKKIIAKPSKNPDEKYYKPQSPGAVIKKEKKKGADDDINNYHYFYPAIEDTPTYDESFPDPEPEKHHQNYQPYIPSTQASTPSMMPAKIEKPVKFSSKKKTHPVVPIESSSTDSYQYQPVLQRPNQYDSSMEDFSLQHEQQFYPAFPQHYQQKNFIIHSTNTPTATIKMLKPAKKLIKDSHYNQFSASMPVEQASPSPLLVRSTASPRIRIKRPTTTAHYEEPKSYSSSPSPTPIVYYQTTKSSDEINFSTTRSPSSFNFSSPRLPINFSTPRSPVQMIYSTPRSPINLSTTRSPASINYSTARSPISHYSIKHSSPNSIKYSTPTSNIVHEPKVYINPSPQITPSVTPSFVDLDTDTSDTHTVHIRPKVQFQQYQPSAKETIIYKFVEPAAKRNISKTDFPKYRTTKPTVSVAIAAPDYFKNLNQTTQDDVEFNNNFNKNYNYQYFTEQDASTFDGDQMKDINQERYNDEEGEEIEDDKQVASKKNMYYSADSNEFMNENPITNDYTPNLEEREMPPPVGLSDAELEPEASKPHQYFVLYDVDEDKRGDKKKKKQHREPEHVTHYHHHDHEKEFEEPDHHHHSYQNDPYAAFDSELLNSDSVRIVDPAVRGGRPIEFSKDDYMRHIKQAVVQYMKDVHPIKDNAGSISSSSSTKLKTQRYHEISETPYRPTKTPSASSTPSSYRNKLPSEQYKHFSSLKLPKGVYHGGRPLKEAIDDLQDPSQAHNVDLTIKKSKIKPFDLSAIDVGQSYQHVSHFDHSAALKNTEEFDQSHAVSHQQPQRPKLHFNQQTYHDINEMGYNKPKQQDDDEAQNLFKGYVLPNKYSGSMTRESSLVNNINFDSSKLPRITHQDDDDEDENKLDKDEQVDAPIQIINGIPVANPYNIDLNTLKYMLGGIAQAEVNDQLKDLDEQPNNNQRYPPSSWKSFSTHSNPLLGSYTANAPVYQVYGNQENSANENVRENSLKPKKNSGNNGNNKNQQNKFPLVGTLMNYNKNKANSNSNNKHRNSNGNNNGHKSNQNLGFNDMNMNYNGWNQLNKKQRSGQQAASSNQQTKVHPSGANYMVLRPVKKNNKNIRDEKIHNKASSNSRVQQSLTELRPPPQIKNHLRVTKVI